LGETRASLYFIGELRCINFKLLAQVKHIVRDVITLVVEAESEKEAFSKAERVLKVYPREADEPGVPYCYIEHRSYSDTEVETIKDMEKDDSA
jgi:hypothetical protein